MERCKETGIYYFSDYEKYKDDYGNKNPSFNKFNGGYILGLKRNESAAVSYFINLVLDSLKKTKCIADTEIITCMPGSQEGRVSEGLVSICRSIEYVFENIRYIKCLNRYKTIEKLAYGGNRSIDVHLNSIEICCGKDIIKNRNIVVLDDVTTTGNSLKAAKHKLLEEGAAGVICMALAKTKLRSIENECINGFYVN